jgi:hypothetical protein
MSDDPLDQASIYTQRIGWGASSWLGRRCSENPGDVEGSVSLGPTLGWKGLLSLFWVPVAPSQSQLRPVTSPSVLHGYRFRSVEVYKMSRLQVMFGLICRVHILERVRAIWVLHSKWTSSESRTFFSGDDKPSFRNKSHIFVIHPSLVSSQLVISKRSQLLSSGLMWLLNQSHYCNHSGQISME